MLQYVEEIIIPYVPCQRELQDVDSPAVIIMDNFKGQVTTPDLLEASNINVCLLAPNTTDLLQPMDISVNKRAGITGALDGCKPTEEDHELESDMSESDDYESASDVQEIEEQERTIVF